MGRKVVKQGGYRVDEFVALDDDSLGDTSEEFSGTDDDSYEESDDDVAIARGSPRPEEAMDPQLLAGPATPKPKAGANSPEGTAVNSYGLVTPNASPASTASRTGCLAAAEAVNSTEHEPDSAIAPKKSGTTKRKVTLVKEAGEVKMSIEHYDGHAITSGIGSMTPPSAHEGDDSYDGFSTSPSPFSTSSEFEDKVKTKSRKRKASSTPLRSVKPTTPREEVTAGRAAAQTATKAKLSGQGAKRLKRG